MNILYLAFACNPYTGSEAQCGWSWVVGMRKYAQVSVVTRKENKQNIQKYLQENNVSDLKVHYCDVPDVLNIYYKTHKAYNFYYLMWQQAAYLYVRKLCKEEKIDIIHHVTLGDFRYLGPYWKTGAKVIFGPVGGAQLTPAVFTPYVAEDIKKEKIREIINTVVTKLPFYRKSINMAELVLAANEETQIYLQKCMKHPERCELLTENGVQSDKINATIEKKPSEITTLLWSGRMVNRKGLAFLLDTLALIPKEKKFRQILVGDGPERKKLEEIVVKKGIADKVNFVGKVPYQVMQEFYKTADIFVFPSLRETTGTVLFEAMANGIPIVSFNQNGARLLVDDSCGIRVGIDQSLLQIQKKFAEAIIELIDNPEKRMELGKNAHDKIISQYIWERKCETFYKRYKQLMEEHE